VGARGDLLEALDQAPGHLRTLEGVLVQWRHQARLAASWERLGGGMRGFVVGGGPVPETTEQERRLWLALPRSWRLETDGFLDVCDGRRRVTQRGDRVTVVDDREPELAVLGLAPVLAPRFVLGALRFAEPVDDELLGRPCWRVAAVLDRENRAFRPAVLGLGGLEHTFWVDRATGLALRHEGRVDGEPAEILAFTELVVDQPIDPSRFAFTVPPGAVVESSTQGIVRLARQRGVDLTGVDTEDPEAVRALLERFMAPGAVPSEVSRRRRRAGHVPVGDPPADPDAARRAIDQAVAGLAEVGPDGTDLVNVQAGRGLAPLLAEARRRAVPSGQVTLSVRDVVFLRPDEAVFWWEAEGGLARGLSGQEGRALLVEGRWVVAHATVVGLLGQAGVVWDPPGDDPQPKA